MPYTVISESGPLLAPLNRRSLRLQGWEITKKLNQKFIHTLDAQSGAALPVCGSRSALSPRGSQTLSKVLALLSTCWIRPTTKFNDPNYIYHGTLAFNLSSKSLPGSSHRPEAAYQNSQPLSVAVSIPSKSEPRPITADAPTCSLCFARPHAASPCSGIFYHPFRMREGVMSDSELYSTPRSARAQIIIIRQIAWMTRAERAGIHGLPQKAFSCGGKCITDPAHH